MVKSVFLRRFRQSLLNLALVVLAFILYDIYMGEGQIDSMGVLAVGVPLLLAEIMGVTGFIKLLKRRREAKDFKYFVALIIDGLITLLVVFTVLNSIPILLKML